MEVFICYFSVSIGLHFFFIYNCRSIIEPSDMDSVFWDELNTPLIYPCHVISNFTLRDSKNLVVVDLSIEFCLVL